MRGKQARSAEHRREEAQSAASIEDYQRKVSRLIDENRALRERLVHQERAAAARERKLRAERDEGVAPQVAALTLAHRAALTARDKALQETRKVHANWDTLTRRLVEHMVTDHRQTGAEAVETLASWTMGRRVVVKDLPNGSIDLAGALLIDRARGKRR